MKTYKSGDSIFLPSDQVVEKSYVNGDEGEPLWMQEFEGNITGNMWTEREILALDPEEITEKVRSMASAADNDNEEVVTPKPRLRVNLAGRDIEETLIHSAQLAYLTPDVPDTLILNQIK